MASPGATAPKVSRATYLGPEAHHQNYELPADVSLEDWTSVVVWCDRFDSAFGAADLVRS